MSLYKMKVKNILTIVPSIILSNLKPFNFKLDKLSATAGSIDSFKSVLA